MSAHPIVGHEFSYLPTPATGDWKGDNPGELTRISPGLRSVPSLLPTPNAQNGENRGNQHPSKRRAGGHAVNLGDVAEHVLLPTPNASVANDGEGADTWLERRERVRQTAKNGNGMGMPLAIAVQLLPTPTAVDGNTVAQSEWDDGNPKRRLKPIGSELENQTDFGQYAPAIERWEFLTDRPAPAPTQPSKTGKPQLSPDFVEWMMGLPDGWVTGVDVTRAQALKMLGNGVVPQQAAAALQQLLHIAKEAKS